MASKKAVIISAPSGSGKTTLVNFLLNNISDLQFSISATSRAPRNYEIPGKDYYFISMANFLKKIRNNEFIEWEEVYNGVYYGTLKSEINNIWSNNKNVIFDVDVQGGINLKKYFGDAGLSIFITVSDMIELEKRLRNRKADSVESIRNRLSKAKNEMEFKDGFDKIVLNDDLDDACKVVMNLVKSFLNK